LGQTQNIIASTWKATCPQLFPQWFLFDALWPLPKSLGPRRDKVRKTFEL
jgi:hypothetical protein